MKWSRRRKNHLSRQSVADLVRRAASDAGVEKISRSTVWRTLRPCGDQSPAQYEHWIFPRDIRFAEKALADLLDLYAGTWEGKPLGRDYVLSMDEDQHSSTWALS